MFLAYSWYYVATIISSTNLVLYHFISFEVLKDLNNNQSPLISKRQWKKVEKECFVPKGIQNVDLAKMKEKMRQDVKRQLDRVGDICKVIYE